MRAPMNYSLRQFTPRVFWIAALAAAAVLGTIVAVPQWLSKQARLDVLRSNVAQIAQLAASAPDCGLHLWVFEANVGAVRFYNRLGGRVVEQKTSEIPAAGAKAVLRVHWPALSQFIWTRRP